MTVFLLCSMQAIWTGGLLQIKSAARPAEREASAGRWFKSSHSDHVGASFVSLAPTYFIIQSALTPLLLLSKSNPLRWASIWYSLTW